jgi:hypothetical protein
MSLQRDTITISNIGGGWLRDFAKGPASSPLTKLYSYYTGLFNLFKPNFLGRISNAIAENPVLMSSVTLPINGTLGSNNHAYVILSNGIIKDFDASVSWSGVSTDWAAPASCEDNEYKDLWKHVNPTGLESVLFTYQTATNAYLGHAQVGNIVNRNNTYFTFTNRNVPHVGCKSVGNQSFITDGQYLQRYDPNAASPTGLRINMGSGWVLCSVVDAGNYVAVVGNDGTNARMWLCVAADVLPTFQYDIRDTTVTAIVNEGGILKVFTKGKNGTTKIKIFNGRGFSEEADWEVPTSLCEPPKHNMVDVFMNQIVWKTPDAYLWTYGSPLKDEVTTGAHRVGLLTTLGAVSNGMVKNLFGNSLFVGMLRGTDEYIYQVKADESYSATVTSMLKTALYELPTNSSIESIEFFFSDYTQPGPSSSGSSLSVQGYKSYDTDPFVDHDMPANAEAPMSVYRYPIPGATVGDIDSFYLDMQFTNCTIKKIEVIYSYETQDL